LRGELRRNESLRKLIGIASEEAVPKKRTQVRLSRGGGQTVFHGEYAACIDHESLDMSVSGCDIPKMFTPIVDRRGDVVAVIGGRHSYAIAEKAAEA
jgi:hypothetical protein